MANFISGLIVLFERPIRIGDVVTVGDTDGTVTRIRIRATTISGWDGKELLVPNKEFITGRLLNWSLSDQATRIIVSVGIAYGSNVRQAMHLLEEAARENENVMDEPAPSVIFETFGDNSLGLLLRCFVDSADLISPTSASANLPGGRSSPCRATSSDGCALRTIRPRPRYASSCATGIW